LLGVDTVQTVSMYRNIKAHGGVEVKPHEFLTSSLDGSVWSTSRADLFTAGERTLLCLA